MVDRRFLARSRDRDYRGRFFGERYDLESLPRLPTFPARWALSDPRRRPYFVFWTRERDGSLFWFLFMWSVGQGEAVWVQSWGGGSYRLSLVRQYLPRRGGTAILYRCPGCWRPRRYLYPLRVVCGVAVDDLGPRCQACLGLPWASQGWYISALGRALTAAFCGPGRRGPRHREPWDPRAVSDPRMVMDEFPEIAFKGTFPDEGSLARKVPEGSLTKTGQDQDGAGACAGDDGLEGLVPIPPLLDL